MFELEPIFSVRGLRRPPAGAWSCGPTVAQFAYSEETIFHPFFAAGRVC